MEKNKLPEYINCKSKYITHCDYLAHPLCKNTCNFSKEILGIGGMTEWVFDPETGIAIQKDKNITKKLHDKLFEEDMKDY